MTSNRFSNISLKHQSTASLDGELPTDPKNLHWAKILDTQKRSGLTQHSFCKKNHISFNQFNYQKQKRGIKLARIKHKAKIVPVNIRHDDVESPRLPPEKDPATTRADN